MTADALRALILSGGGGRGAFHAGVYKYLMRKHKLNLDSDHTDVWEPQIIVGTSIGAVNGAAIAQGMSLAVCLWLYSLFQPGYVYPIMAYCILMILYLNSQDVRMVFRPGQSPRASHEN